MKYLFLSLLLIPTLFVQPLKAQDSDVRSLIEQGIAAHDNKAYDEAIASYKKALELSPNSSLIHYELSLSYFAKGDYETCILHADTVIGNNGKHLTAAHLTKGSALDMLGKTSESIKLLKKAIKKDKKEHLLRYNLAVNYFKLGALEDAEEMLIATINIEKNHASSHLLLARLQNKQQQTIPTLLASYYFLLLEPNSARSELAHEFIQSNFGANVKADKSNPDQINITLPEVGTGPFSSAELMLAMIAATNEISENKEKTTDSLFIDNSRSIFKMLHELKEKKDKGIWWDFYIPFFYQLVNSNHFKTFCMYISSQRSETANEWLANNPEAVDNLFQWLNK